MSFLVTACGHSGTKLFAEQLGKARGWTVKHEPDEGISWRIVSPRFEVKPNYGEVNSYLLTSIQGIKADRKGILLRNPYDICRSIARTGYGQYAIPYVRECVSILDNLASKKLLVFLFRKITSDVDYVVSSAKQLGITLDPNQVDVETKVNRHLGNPVSLTFDTITQLEFDDFMERYDL